MRMTGGRYARVALALRAPIRTAKTTLSTREVLFVELLGQDDGGADAGEGSVGSAVAGAGSVGGVGSAKPASQGNADGGASAEGGGGPSASLPESARELRGYGEGVAFETDWYLPETLDEDEAVMPALLDALVGREISHPREVDAILREVRGAANLPMARAAVEPAVWDLYAQAQGLPLVEYLAEASTVWRARREGESGPAARWEPGGQAGAFAEAGITGMAKPRNSTFGKASADGADEATASPGEAGLSGFGWAAGGVVVPLGTQAETLAAVAAAKSAGYERVKLKISEAGDLFALRAIRAAHPELQVIADANGAFTEREFVRIRDEVDSIGLACIEEPIAREAGESIEAFYARLEAVQLRMATPICLDESWTCREDLDVALRHTQLRCYALKLAKLGGIGPALEFLDAAAERGIAVWMGGMFDSGISKAAHAALGLHPAIAFAGDISDTSRYFTEDPCRPAFELEGGHLPLTRPGLGWAVRPELFEAR